MEKQLYTQVSKVDEELGLIMGYAIVCSEQGEPYFDLQGDHIPEEAMLKAATDFMTHSAAACEMHSGGPIGSIVFAWPLTAEIALAMGLECKKTGLMIAMKPRDPAVVKMFRDGHYTGFSIGGRRIRDVPHE